MIEFNKYKNYTIEELETILNQIYDIQSFIRKKIIKLRIKEYDYEHKFIYYKDYGYMYVTWQKYDEHSIYNDERMFFQGLTFKSSFTNYKDDSYFSYDALDEWRIPISTFIRDVEENNIKIISKEDFFLK